MDVRTLTDPVVAEATGRTHRDDQVLPGSGGPAGNARLTAWVGLVLLVGFGAELITLLDVRGLVSWHVAIGIALIPPALLKMGTTGWRIVRYYTGNRPYRRAGPPPLLLRVLGPLVVLTTLGVLATGVILIVIGAPASRQPLLTAAGHSLDATTLHKATFVLWAGVTGLHVLGRLLPALQMTLARWLGPISPRPVGSGGPPGSVPGFVPGSVPAWLRPRLRPRLSARRCARLTSRPVPAGWAGHGHGAGGRRGRGRYAGRDRPDRLARPGRRPPGTRLQAALRRAVSRRTSRGLERRR